MDAVFPLTSTINIMDLNDDCLLEIFNYVHLTDLCAVADVCHRFRQNAQSHLAASKTNYKIDALQLHCDDKEGAIILQDRLACSARDKLRSVYFGDCSLHQRRRHISNFLRNFGMLVKSIKIYHHLSRCSDIAATAEHMHDVFDLITIYCRATLDELDLRDCSTDINGEIENSVRPLLLHLRTLKLNRLKYSELLGRSLSLWAPELRALHIECASWVSTEIDHILVQPFRRLETFSFSGTSDMKSNRLEEFFKLNPPVKKVGLSLECPNVDGRIVQSIASHVADIEALEISSINYSDLKCIGKLNNLNVLTSV